MKITDLEKRVFEAMEDDSINLVIVRYSVKDTGDVDIEVQDLGDLAIIVEDVMEEFPEEFKNTTATLEDVLSVKYLDYVEILTTYKLDGYKPWKGGKH